MTEGGNCAGRVWQKPSGNLRLVALSNAFDSTVVLLGMPHPSITRLDIASRGHADMQRINHVFPNATIQLVAPANSLSESYAR